MGIDYGERDALVASIVTPTMAPRPTLATTPALLYWRTRRGFLQRELAALADVDLTTVQRLERGKTARLDTIRHLAEALKVEPSDLMAQPPKD